MASRKTFGARSQRPGVSDFSLSGAPIRATGADMSLVRRSASERQLRHSDRAASCIGVSQMAGSVRTLYRAGFTDAEKAKSKT